MLLIYINSFHTNNLNFQSEITNSQLFRRNVTEKWRTVAERISVKWADDYPSHQEISNAKILGNTIKQKQN